MKRQLFIAHADSEQDLAERLARPLEEAGYEVIHRGTVLVGESIIAAAQQVLEADGPVVLCATARAVGMKWANLIAKAARKNARGRVYVVQMEEDTYVDNIAMGEAVAEWWKDPSGAMAQLIDRLKEHYPLDEESSAMAKLHGAERRYRQLALAAFDIINLANLPESDHHRAARKLELRGLYVPLHVRLPEASKHESFEARQLALEKSRERAWRGLTTHEDPERVPFGAQLEKSRRLVVLGDPGAGKSTLLRWLSTAYLLRLNQDSNWKSLPGHATLPDKDWLPVLIRCRDLDSRALSGSMEDMLRHTLRKMELSEPETHALILLFARKLAAGEALLLVDGLDEISEISVRVRFCEQFERIKTAHPTTPIVVTSRIVGYREMGGQRIGHGFEHVTVADLNSADKHDFVHRWCALTEPPERQEAIATELIQDIHSKERIQRLTGNPMMLTTMVLVKRKVGKLPRRRWELYREAVQVLLNWRSAESEDFLDPWEALPQLGFIAYAMCDRGVQRLRRNEVLDLLHQLRREYPNLHEVKNHTPEQFLVLLERRTGILIESGHESHLGRTVPVYEFRHLTFQEYLAACALVERCFPAAPLRSLAENIAPIARRVAETLSTHTLKVANVLRQGGFAQATVAAEEGQSVVNLEEVLRLCVSFCPNDDVDNILFTILEPQQDENLERTRIPRVNIAIACLADEPNASGDAVRRILEKFIHLIEFAPAQIHADSSSEQQADYFLVWAKTSFITLTGTRWAQAAARALVTLFQRGDVLIRRKLLEVWLYYNIPDALLSQEQFSTWLAQLSSPNELDALEAALMLYGGNWHLNDMIHPISGEFLIALLERGGPLAHAAALALSDLESSWSMKRLCIPTPRQLEQLVSLMKSETTSSEVDVSVLQVLGREGLSSAVGPMVTRLSSPDPDLRRMAAHALGEVRDVSALDPLLKASRDPDAMVRQTAITSLGRRNRSRHWLG